MNAKTLRSRPVVGFAVPVSGNQWTRPALDHGRLLGLALYVLRVWLHVK